MKKLMCILLASMTLLQVNAQKEENEMVLASIGAKWYYGIRPFSDCKDEHYIIHEVIKDTIIESRRGVVIEEIEHTKYGNYLKGYEYICSEQEKVYHWDKNTKKFTLLYDFSAIAGDSWIARNPYNPENEITVKVTAIDYIDVSGVKLKRLSISSEGIPFSGLSWWDYPIIFEFYLFERTGLLDYKYMHRFLPSTGGPDFSERCYIDDEITIKYSDIECDGIIATGISQPVKEFSDLIISNDYVQLPASLQLKTDKAELYDTDGKIVLSKKIDDNQRISVSNLPAGIFILSIKTKNDGIKTFKINKL